MGEKDLKAFWGEYVPHASNIDFYFEREGTPWGTDDDTDIEYMYLHLLFSEQATKLTPSLIRDAWLKHTYSNEDAPLFIKFPDSNPIRENFLWVSNEKARVLMAQGVFPPETSKPQINQYYNMIDAQLSTEIFGLLLPNAPNIAIDFSRLAVQTSARNEAESIANFYIAMHSLATSVDKNVNIQEQVIWLADKATKYLHENEFPIKMYQFVKSHYLANTDKSNWESTRDAVYKRYQISSHDGYRYTEPYDAGINFAASLISLFYGGGDLKETIRIGTLTGWDSDNPTATWGGLLGFMLDVEGVKHAFNEHDVSDSYWIHRTRRNFPDYTQNQKGEDTFNLMARRMLRIIRTLEKHNKLTH